jgi:hypothetical protein
MPEEISDAWAAIVLAEAATSYAYASVGPLLEPDQRTTAAQWYDEHERARDDALLALTGAGAPPIAIPPFFALPEPLDGPGNAAALLATVESRLALSYADLVAALPLADRQRGIDGVLLANERALTWGATNGAWGAQTPETAEAAG